jgi:transcriptional regulator with XRE-family HTH domain
MATIPCDMHSDQDCNCARCGHECSRVQIEEDRPLHRIAEVRSQQGLSLRAISRRTGIDIRDLKQQELATTDLSLRDLHRWAAALEVPVDSLLVDRDHELSSSVRDRAALVKIMKTVVAVQEIATSPRVARMTEMLREQLLAMMPELAEVGGWPNYGSRRPQDHVGRIAGNPINVDNLSLE